MGQCAATLDEFRDSGRKVAGGAGLRRDKSSRRRGHGGSSKFVTFTTQEDVRWSRGTAPVFLACTRGGAEWSDGLLLELAAVSIA